MPKYPTAPSEIFFSIIRNRDLIKTSVYREVLGRYRGSIFGLLWSFLNPLFMLSVYTFVFSTIFKARWSIESDSKAEFALVLFAGLIFFNIFSEAITRSPSLITNNTNYVKKVIFPLEILPVVNMLSALFHGIISLGVWIIAYWLLIGPPHFTVIYIPVIIMPFLLLILGFSWILASLGTFLRDVSQIINPLVAMMMFMSPIFYPITALPEELRHWLYYNPLTPTVEQVRDILYWGNKPDLTLLGSYTAISALIAWLGFVWFQKTRKGFADVL